MKESLNKTGKMIGLGCPSKNPSRIPSRGQDPSFIDFLGFPYVEFIEGFFNLRILQIAAFDLIEKNLDMYTMMPLNVDLTLDINDLSSCRIMLRYSYRAGAMRQVRVFVCVLHVSLRCGDAALKLLCYSCCSATSLLGTCALSIRVFQVSCGIQTYTRLVVYSWATYFVGVEATNLVPTFYRGSLVSADGSSCFLGGGNSNIFYVHPLFGEMIQFD